ncbi:MAG: hypothetical protein PHO02_06325 [Candidatus Nanoarchaeia archaeon]|nr:hypothetical protein [Candidatus Nanoarchaeia archaeon]
MKNTITKKSNVKILNLFRKNIFLSKTIREIAILVLFLMAVSITACKLQKDTVTEEDIKSFEDYVMLQKSIVYDAEYVIEGEGSEKASARVVFDKGIRVMAETLREAQLTRVYVNEEGPYMCFKAGDNWECSKTLNEYDPFNAFMPELFSDLKKHPEVFRIEYDGIKLIGGKQAYCYKASVDENAAIECFSKEGVPVYMEIEGSQNGRIYTLDYKTSITESDFFLPAKPQEDIANQRISMPG